MDIWFGRSVGNDHGNFRLEREWQTPVEMLVPIPLHAKRLSERGYNQSELLADRLAQHLNRPMMPSALIRTRFIHGHKLVLIWISGAIMLTMHLWPIRQTCGPTHFARR